MKQNKKKPNLNGIKHYLPCGPFKKMASEYRFESFDPNLLIARPIWCTVIWHDSHGKDHTDTNTHKTTIYKLYKLLLIIIHGQKQNNY